MPAVDVDLQRIAVGIRAFVGRELRLDPGKLARGEAVAAIENAAFLVENDRMLKPARLDEPSVLKLKQKHHAAQNLCDDDGCDHGICDRSADHQEFSTRRDRISIRRVVA